MYNLNILPEEKIPTQFVVTHYRDNTCGTGGGTTLTSFRNIINMKTLIAVVQKAQQFPQLSLVMAE
jgi:hypothetical protein